MAKQMTTMQAVVAISKNSSQFSPVKRPQDKKSTSICSCNVDLDLLEDENER